MWTIETSVGRKQLDPEYSWEKERKNRIHFYCLDILRKTYKFHIIVKL